MKPTKLIGLVALAIVIPGTISIANNSALAGEVQINTPNVEAITRKDGSVYVNSGGTKVEISSRRNYWMPWRYWRLPWRDRISDHRHHNRCLHRSSQSTSRVTASGSQILQSSISSNICK